jgi:hypothetical protein
MDELDEEVWADIGHRNRSEKDPRRSREAVNPTDATKHPALRIVSTTADHGPSKRDPIAEGERNRERSDRMAEYIREYRDSLLSPDREKQVLQQIRFLGHPNIDGLIRAVTDRRVGAAAGAKSKRRV